MANKEIQTAAILAGIFLFFYFIPFDSPAITAAVLEAFRLLQWYVREHTLACVVPAMFIAGAISTFLSQASVLQYLGPNSNRVVAYSVASVAGVILAVCSCSVLPMFAGIYTMGAGLGPASAFLYSGPAINVMAIFLSARVLGFDLGLARALGSIAFAFVIGLTMAWVFRHEEKRRSDAVMQLPPPPPSPRNLWQTSAYFLCMVLFLTFSDWYNTNDVTMRLSDGSSVRANIRYQTAEALDIQAYLPGDQLSPEVKRIQRAEVREIVPVPSVTMTIHGIRWYLAGLMGFFILVMLKLWFTREEIGQWLVATWDFGKTIVPLLFGGVFVTGFVSSLVPQKAVAALVGTNSVFSNLVASFVGMCWYFATLTEIPITQALMKLGMAKGPALALLLAGPALSIPSILVLQRIMGSKKTFVFCLLTVVMSTIVGVLFGAFVGG